VSASWSLLRCFGLAVLMEVPVLAQVQQATVTQVPSTPAQSALRLDIPHSDNPLNTYRATLVPQPNLANSSRIDSLIKDGVLELSLKDAISLALENNLDIAIARYNIPIAAADVMRTQAGG
jgi:outer membrane protein TolC